MTNILDMNTWIQIIKPFTFLLIFTGLLLTFSCKTTSTVSIQQITGNWQEKEPTEVVQYVGSSHYIEFSANNTFQLSQNHWTDMLDPNAPCRANRTDYIKGFYKLKGSTLKLTGSYYDTISFVNKKPNCKNQSAFNQTYQIEITADGERVTLDKNEVQPDQQILLIKQ